MTEQMTKQMAERLAALIADGLAEDVIADFAHKRELQRRRERYAADPDKAMASRRRQAASLLRRCGGGVIETLPPLPWDGDTARQILHELAAQARGRR